MTGERERKRIDTDSDTDPDPEEEKKDESQPIHSPDLVPRRVMVSLADVKR